jgi:isoquinoline 1-oxidoreductase subunit alpha
LEISVNGITRRVEAPPDTPLLWVLREELGLTGTKYGCGIGVCGACTIHFGGAPVPACVLPIASVEGIPITTIEGLADGGILHPVQQAWLDADVSQCGYCQPGMIMAVTALLRDNPHPDEDAVKAGVSVLCRCGTYPRVLQAIRSIIAQ